MQGLSRLGLAFPQLVQSCEEDAPRQPALLPRGLERPLASLRLLSPCIGYIDRGRRLSAPIGVGSASGDGRRTRAGRGPRCEEAAVEQGGH